MTELIDWSESYCEMSLATGEPTVRACAETPVYADDAGVVRLPAAAMEDDGSYRNWLRCLMSVQPPLAPGQHIKLTIDDLDLTRGDILTVFSANDTNSMPLAVLSGSTKPDTPIYSPDGAEMLLVAFESDSVRNDGFTGFSLSYEVIDEDLDAITGCNDPLAVNYDSFAEIGKATTCEYDFADGSLLFTGSSGHVDVPDASVLADHLPARAITISVWVKIEDRNANDYTSYISHMQDDYRDERGFGLGFLDLPAEGILSHSCAIFTMSNEGSLFTAENYVYSDAVENVKFGEFQHVACTYDGLTVSLYVDGVLVASGTKQIGDILYPDEDYSAKHSSSSGALLTLGAFHDQVCTCRRASLHCT